MYNINIHMYMLSQSWIGHLPIPSPKSRIVLKVHLYWAKLYNETWLPSVPYLLTQCLCRAVFSKKLFLGHCQEGESWVQTNFSAHTNFDNTTGSCSKDNLLTYTMVKWANAFTQPPPPQLLLTRFCFMTAFSRALCPFALPVSVAFQLYIPQLCPSLICPSPLPLTFCTSAMKARNGCV